MLTNAQQKEIEFLEDQVRLLTEGESVQCVLERLGSHPEVLYRFLGYRMEGLRLRGVLFNGEYPHRDVENALFEASVVGDRGAFAEYQDCYHHEQNHGFFKAMLLHVPENLVMAAVRSYLTESPSERETAQSNLVVALEWRVSRVRSVAGLAKSAEPEPPEQAEMEIPEALEEWMREKRIQVGTTGKQRPSSRDMYEVLGAQSSRLREVESQLKGIHLMQISQAAQKKRMEAQQQRIQELVEAALNGNAWLENFMKDRGVLQGERFNTLNDGQGALVEVLLGQAENSQTVARYHKEQFAILDGSLDNQANQLGRLEKSLGRMEKLLGSISGHLLSVAAHVRDLDDGQAVLRNQLLEMNTGQILLLGNVAEGKARVAEVKEVADLLLVGVEEGQMEAGRRFDELEERHDNTAARVAEVDGKCEEIATCSAATQMELYQAHRNLIDVEQLLLPDPDDEEGVEREEGVDEQDHETECSEDPEAKMDKSFNLELRIHRGRSVEGRGPGSKLFLLFAFLLACASIPVVKFAWQALCKYYNL